MEPYDPLAIENIANSMAVALLAQDPQPLPPEGDVMGAGVYLLYYMGPFELYAPVSNPACLVPVYVGKAVSGGRRTGGEGIKAAPKASLKARLRKHAQSVGDAENLDVVDFRCRYLVLEDIWVGLAEDHLIRLYTPLWNSKLLAGFGINAPGKGRMNQKRSLWDTLHPGRGYARDLPEGRPVAGIAADVGRYLRGEADAAALIDYEGADSRAEDSAADV